MECLTWPYQGLTTHSEGIDTDQNQDLKYRAVTEINCNYCQHDSLREIGKQLVNRPNVLFIEISCKVYVLLLKGFILGEARPLWPKKSKDFAEYQK